MEIHGHHKISRHIYVIQRVSFGDKPSGTIATVALRKTAEMGQNDYPHAARVIKENT